VDLEFRTSQAPAIAMKREGYHLITEIPNRHVSSTAESVTKVGEMISPFFTSQGPRPLGVIAIFGYHISAKVLLVLFHFDSSRRLLLPSAEFLQLYLKLVFC
jgi:hypothetical protein